ncbi:hypothetical protein JZ751_018183 [Albula glossodonta]|uniref:Transcription factor Adf-1-like n=1 Tax=Albula glossodonta TaxID=121402 RepID=A0A8T2PQ83_9TELE|nr:hypothetical protein JZ751_018183 [Albula glossodonta]
MSCSVRCLVLRQVLPMHRVRNECGINWPLFCRKMDEEKLIFEVEKHRELYDPQDRLYKDNVRKDAAWSAVAVVVGASADECKAKWRVLRDAFVRKKRKQAPSGSGASSTRDWKYSEIMSFLLPYLQPRSSRTNLEVGESTTEEDRPYTPMDLSQVEETPAEQGPVTAAPRFDPPLPATRGEGRRKRRRDHTDVEERLLALISQPPPTQPTQSFIQEQDEVQLFVLSLAPIIKRLNPRNQARAKIQILTVLDNLEAEQEHHTVTTVRPIPSPTESTPVLYFRGRPNWEQQHHSTRHSPVPSPPTPPSPPPSQDGPQLHQRPTSGGGLVEKWELTSIKHEVDC